MVRIISSAPYKDQEQEAGNFKKSTDKAKRALKLVALAI